MIAVPNYVTGSRRSAHNRAPTHFVTCFIVSIAPIRRWIATRNQRESCRICVHSRHCTYLCDAYLFGTLSLATGAAAAAASSSPTPNPFAYQTRIIIIIITAYGEKLVLHALTTQTVLLPPPPSSSSLLPPPTRRAADVVAHLAHAAVRAIACTRCSVRSAGARIL